MNVALGGGPCSAFAAFPFSILSLKVKVKENTTDHTVAYLLCLRGPRCTLGGLQGKVTVVKRTVSRAVSMLSMDIQEYKMMQKNNGCQQGQEFPDVGPFDWSPPQRCRCSSYRPACLPCHAMHTGLRPLSSCFSSSFPSSQGSKLKKPKTIPGRGQLCSGVDLPVPSGHPDTYKYARSPCTAKVSPCRVPSLLPRGRGRKPVTCIELEAFIRES